MRRCRVSGLSVLSEPDIHDPSSFCNPAPERRPGMCGLFARSDFPGPARCCVTSPLMLVEPMVEGLALVAGMAWIFHTVRRIARTGRDQIRLTIAAIAVAFVTAVILEYLRFRVSGSSARVVIDLASALLLPVVGIAWLRPAILCSTGIRLPPTLLSLVVPPGHLSHPVSSASTPAPPGRCRWPAIGLTGGLLVTALNNGDVAMTVPVPASLALLLISWPLVTGLAGRPAALGNTMLRAIAGVLFAALGSLQVSELLGVGWHHPALVLSALIAGFLATTFWLIDTCRGGESRQPLSREAHADPVPRSSRITASTRTRNALLAAMCVSGQPWLESVCTSDGTRQSG